LDGIPRTTPFVHDTVIDFHHSVEAVNQTVGPNLYVFQSWSDGGSQQHQIVVPASPQSYTASYSVTSNPSLVAAFNFDEGSGATLIDRSGNNNHGVVTGATWTAGKYGSALSFSGSSNLVTINDSASLRLTTAFTLEAWVKATVVLVGWQDVIYKGIDEYYLEGNSWGGVAGGAATAGGGSQIVSNRSLVPGVWTHVALTYDGAVLKIYVDGSVHATEPASGSVVTSANPLTIGGDPIFGQFFQGAIDEVRIYNRALSEAQIQADMSAPIQ
jgi:hypothetical protein